MLNLMTILTKSKEIQTNLKAMLGMHCSRETMKLLAKYLNKMEIGKIV